MLCVVSLTSLYFSTSIITCNQVTLALSTHLFSGTMSKSKLAQRCYNVLLLGAPGAGKGTYGKLMASAMNAKQMESGALCRAAAQSGDAQIREIMAKGTLIGDDLIFDMVVDYLKQNQGGPTKTSLLFDGFPRTVDQATRFHHEIASEFPLDLAIHFKLPHHILKEKLLGRRVCTNKECGANYNVTNIDDGDIIMPPLNPQKEGICDKCGSELTMREDDNATTIENRLNLFYETNDPLIKFYHREGILMNYSIKRGIG